MEITNDSPLAGRKPRSMEGFLEMCNLITKGVLPMCLHAVVQLGVADIISRSGASMTLDEIVDQLPRKTPGSAEKLGRIMNVLVQEDVFSKSIEADGPRFGLNQLSDWLVTSEEFNVAPFTTLEMLEPMVLPRRYLHTAVLDGSVPFVSVHGEEFFNYVSHDPEMSEALNKCLMASAKQLNWTIANEYQGFAGVQTLVDVGGNKGQALASILKVYPHIKGINFDLPHVIKSAIPSPGVEHVTGDFFKEVPKGDAILLQHILHDWEDDKCITILKNCYKSLPEAGKLVISDAVLRSTADKGALSRRGHVSNIQMTTFLRGKERTGQEWKDLLTNADFKRINFLNLSGGIGIVEAFKC